MGRKITTREKELVDSQLENISVALDIATVKVDRWFDDHVTVPAISSLSELLTDAIGDQVTSDLADLLILWQQRMYQAKVVPEVQEALDTFLAKLRKEIFRICHTSYVAGFEMGRTGNEALELEGVCRHFDDEGNLIDEE